MRIKKKFTAAIALVLSVLMIATSVPIFAETDDHEEIAQIEELAEIEGQEDIDDIEEIESIEDTYAEDDGEVSAASLLPLEEVEAALVLNGYSEEEIKNMPLQTVLNLLRDSDGNYIEIPDDATILWGHFKDEEGNIIRDEYHEVARDETVDLSDFEYSTGYTMELIVGSGNQLDPTNVRYIVRTYISNTIHEELQLELYKENESGVRQKVVPKKEKVIGMSFMGMDETAYTYVVPDHVAGTEYYLGISSIADKHPDLQVDIYTVSEFYNYLYYGSANATPITSQILNQDMTKSGAGRKTVLDLTTDPAVVMENNMYVWTLSDKETGYLFGYKFHVIYVTPEILTFDAEVYTYENSKMLDVVAYKASLAEILSLGEIDNGVITGTGIEQLCLMLKEGYSSDTDYYIVLDVDSLDYSDSIKDHIVKAVHGVYDSLEYVTDLPDIKYELFPEDTNTTPYGFKTSYDGDGKGVYNYFTIFFDDGSLTQLEVVILEYSEKLFATKTVDYFAMPIIGAQDPWFRLTGIEGLDSYVIENGGKYNLDTYYGYGYQTVLVNDANVDLSHVKPEFWFAADDYFNLYKIDSDGGVLQDPENPDSITGVNQQYSLAWKDDDTNEKVRNYWLSVVKKVTGKPALFVDGPGDGEKREICLTEYFENKHDVFVANVGDQSMYISARLSDDAVNVKLDDYWTVGGENNQYIAPFTITSTDSDYSEIPNAAKIRLLRDGDSEGEISGELIIESSGGLINGQLDKNNNYETYTIDLTGTAGSPEFVTKSIKPAVKYVPYQSIIATNNMYDWNDVSFKLVSGNLPEGMTFNESTGELYGVPTEAKDYKFTVRADYSNETFESSLIELTLTVKDNTDENVAGETDEEYEIIKHIPDTVYGKTDEVFEFEYDYAGHEDEFQGFWLDGKKLTPNVDYTVEAGSTKITIKSQTISNTNDGKHTIAAEYRNKSNEVKKAAQNFNKGSNNSNNNGNNYSYTGGGGFNTPTTYKVWYETNGGAWLDAIDVKSGATVGVLPTPIRDGYIFDGWYTDEALTQLFSGDTVINKTTTLYAKWVKSCNVWFETNGGAWIDSIEVESGNTIPQFPTPERAGYTFGGWYKDAGLTQLFDANEIINDTITLYAKWEVGGDVAPPADASGFVDVYADEWYYPEVDWAYSNKLMVGTSNSMFSPNEFVTGGMVATVLARIANADVNEYAGISYDDVFEGEWYTPYAKWAKTIGLVENTPFNPPTEISRENMGIIILRYLNYAGVELVPTAEDVVFADENAISEQARESIHILYTLGIFKGIGENYIDPARFTTRAEFAALMHRVCDYIQK